MSREKTSYSLLIEKLDQFIRKYYINQLIRGSLYSIGLIVVCFMLFSLVEYFFYFGTGMRKVLFFAFLGISAFSLIQWVGMPIVHYFRLGKIISHEQAAQIIGQHFQNVNDKLINILQLSKQADNQKSNDLIMASIEQKTQEIQPVPFMSAIDLSKNRKYLRYALPPLLLLLGLLVGAPSLIKDPANRIIKNNQAFEREAPFYFHLANSELEVPQYEDYKITVNVDGDYLPEQAFVVANGFQYRLKKESPSTFSYTFNNVQQDQEFNFEAEGVTSQDYALSVLKKPSILDFSTSLDYPAYVRRSDEVLNNVGDLVVPAGTKIDWTVKSVNTEDLWYQLQGEEIAAADRIGSDDYTFNHRFYQNNEYKLIIGNAALPKGDSVSYTVSVIPDLYPSISMKQFEDSTNQKLVYLVGDASDDYGLKRLTFNYSISNKGTLQGDPVVMEMKQPEGKTVGFDHVFNINDLTLKPGDEVSYYFEVWDNDGVHGSKSSRTTMQVFAQPTVEEFEQMEDANEEDIKKALDESRQESENIKKDFKKLREKMLQEKSVDWQIKKELEDLLNRQQNLEEELNEAREKFEENLENQQAFDEIDQETLEKQEKIRELFEELADEETKELMEKIQELMEELNKDEALEMMENMELNEEELTMELDRLKELYKQLELERDLKQEIEKLQELAEEQLKLSEETAEEENQELDQEQNEDLNSEEAESEDAETEDKDGENADDQKEGEDKAEDTEQEDNAQQEEGKEGAEQSEQDQNNEGQQEDQQGQEQEGDQQQGEQSEQNQENQEQGLQEQQEQINEAFEKIQEQLKELEERNSEMQSPKEMGDNEEQMDDIQQDLEQSLQQLQQQQNQNASKSQKNAGQKMQQMAQQMEQQMQEGDMQQMNEDMAAMRQLLENLIALSFDQEAMISDFNRTHTSTPEYQSLVQKQYKLKDDFHLIEDSLQALSQRVFEIESFVLEKVSDINKNMDKSLKLLEDRKKAQASDNQQRTMKNVNDLALMFSESMNQMQQQMAAMMSGQQMCTKPGSNSKEGEGNVPMDKISEGQKQLNGDMQKMKDGMQKSGQQGSSKEFAQMAAKQAALRKALRDVQRAKQAQGQGSKELEEILEQMDKIETDLVNKRLTNEMITRQEEILTRLLESERAEREKEYDNERKSKTAQAEEKPIPPAVEEYIRERESQIEPFKTISPALKPYYKQLVEEYYKSLKDN